MKLRVWWIPQVPMQAFYAPVATVEEGARVLSILADYDIFQYENNVKPDYSNAGGLEMFDPDDHTDGADGSWVDWYDEETCNDYPLNRLQPIEDR